MSVRPRFQASTRLNDAGPPRVSAAIEAMEWRRLFSVYFVATTGSDEANGTLQAPFQTIQQAAGIAQPGDTVMIEGGTYNQTVTPAQSGLPGQPITYEAYEGQTVVISGTDPVTGWTEYQGSTYQASMPWDMGAGRNQVFVDGQPLNEARWPASSLDLSHPTYAHADNIMSNIADGVNASTATLQDADLTQPAGFWDGATIRFDPGQGWAFQTGTVTDSSPGRLTFSFTSYAPTRPYTDPSAGNAFSLIGTAGALDAPGEFYRGPSGTLYVWTPAGDSPAGHDIEVQDRQYGFNLSGDSDIDLVGLTFFADTIETDDSSHGLTLENLNIRYPNEITDVPDAWHYTDDSSNSGLALYGSDNDFKNSTLGYSAGNGVLLSGSNNTVQGCSVHDVDYVGGNFSGITSIGANADIYDNIVYNSGRDGIRVSSSAGVHIINSVIHDVMLQTTDGGGIYTYGTDGSSSEIAYNQVYNINAGGFGAAGIYLDNYDSHWTVDHNTVWNCTYALKLNPPNTDDLIEDNILSGNSQSVDSSGSRDMGGTVFSNNTFTGAVDLGPGAVEENNIQGGAFTPPAVPVPDPNLAGQHGSAPPSPGGDAATSAPVFAEPTLVPVEPWVFTTPAPASDKNTAAPFAADQDVTTPTPASAGKTARPTPVPNPNIAADEQVLQSDLAQLVADTGARSAALAADQATIRSDKAAAAVVVASDRAALLATRAADLAAVRATEAADDAPMLKIDAKIRADRRHPRDRAKQVRRLAAARARYKSDEAAGLAHVAQDTATLQARIVAATTPPIETSDLQKLKSDETTWAATLAADAAKIGADRATLRQDEIA